MTSRRTFIAGAAALIPALAAVTAPAAFAQSSRAGTFTGKSRHVTTGTGAIVEQDGKTYVVLGDDFTFDGAPDPKVALGNDGYDKSTLMGLLKANSGKQQFQVPAGIDASQYNEIWIWCEKFNVPLGLAKLGS